MKQERVKRSELRGLDIGERRRFELTNPTKCQSAQQTASQLKAEGFEFVCECSLEQRMKGIIFITRIK